MSVGLRTFAPAALLGVCLALPPAPAAAQKLIDEFKIGGMAHDVTLGGRHLEGGADVNIELLFTPPDILRFIGSPRPHIGGDINTSGNTSQGYFGLTWGIMLIQSLFGAGDGVFVNGSLGGAIHDGYLNTAPPDRKRLGSRILFRESAELGYQLTPNTQRLGDRRPYLKRQSGEEQRRHHQCRRAVRLQVLSFSGASTRIASRISALPRFSRRSPPLIVMVPASCAIAGQASDTRSPRVRFRSGISQSFSYERVAVWPRCDENTTRRTKAA